MYTEEESRNGVPPRATESLEGNAGCVVVGAQSLGLDRLRALRGGVWELRRKQASPGACFAAGIVCLAAGHSLGSRGEKEGARRQLPGARSELLGRGPRTYVCAPWGGAGRVHGTGRTRAGTCARFREPQRRGAAPRGENAAQSPDAAGHRTGAPSGLVELSLRPFGGHAKAEPQCPEAGGQAATDSIPHGSTY